MTETIYKIEIGDYRIASKFSQINSLDAVENFLAAFKDAVRTIHEKHNQLKHDIDHGCHVDFRDIRGHTLDLHALHTPQGNRLPHRTVGAPNT